MNVETQNQATRISASIVVYRNDAEQLLSAIRSVLNSSLRVALTVIDNSPTDDLEKIVRSTTAEYLFSGANLGFGRGHNLALRKHLETSEYHLVLNPDVRFCADVIQTLLRFMDDNPNIGLVMPKVLYPDSSEQRLCKLVPSPLDLLTRRFLPGVAGARLRRYTMDSIDFATPRFVPVLSGCFMFLRTSVLQKVGVFDERYFMYLEDVDLSRRVAAVADSVFFPYVTIEHEYAKGSYLSVGLLRHHLQSAWRYFCKWGWFIDPERDRLNERALEEHPLNVAIHKYAQSL